jgi:hypothetical protein
MIHVTDLHSLGMQEATGEVRDVRANGKASRQDPREYGIYHAIGFSLRHWFVVLALLFAVLPVFAQQDTGTITGTVTDSSGALIAGAYVRVINQGTAQESVLKTDGAGLFVTPPLSVGKYSIEVLYAGFSKAVQQDIQLDAAQRYSTVIKLAVGSDTVSVVVTTQTTGVDSTDGTVGAVIDERSAQELPINGRSVLALATLTPGVVSGVGAVSEGFNDRGTAVSAIRISGGALGVNNILLDGSNNLLTYLGEAAINPKSDAVSEFRILSGVMSAQFGYTSGGVINIVTRAGTNKLHGAVYEFFRNDYLDAKNYFADPSIPKPEIRYNQPGIALGGPILRNKLFFFSNYEVYRIIQEAPQAASVPTLRQRTGDFSDYFQLLTVNGQPTCSNAVPGRATPYIQIYDPETGTNVANRNAFPGNIILPSRLDPVALAIQSNFYPLPNNTSGVYNSCTNSNNYVSNSRSHSNDTQSLSRVDWNIRPGFNIFTRYGLYRNNTDNNGVLDVVASGRNDHLRTQNGTVGFSTALSPQLVNELRLSGLRSDFGFQAGSANQNWPTRLGLPGVSPLTLPAISNGLPGFNTTFGFRAATSFQIVDDVTMVVATHTIHIGADLHFDQAYNAQAGVPSGSFGFSTTTTGFGTNSSSTTGTGSAYASFLLGAASGASNTTVVGSTFREFRYAGYVQDDWQAGRRLTLNLGLRYDYQQQPYETRKGIGNFDINQVSSNTGFLGRQVYAGTGGYGGNFVKENYLDFSPRVGFAMALDGASKTIIRGGFAIYYPANANNNYALSAGSTNGFGTITTTYSSVTGNGVVLYLRNGFPYAPALPAGAAGGQDAFLGQTGIYINPDAKTSQSQQYTLTVSHLFPSKVVVDVTFLGNHGVHFPVAPYNLNRLDPSYYYLGTQVLATSVPNPYAGKVPGTYGSSTITEANLLRPFPYMTSVTANYPHIGNYIGDYVFVQAQRRVARGLQLLAGYTFGKLLADPIYVQLGTTGGVTPSSSGSGVGAYQNIYNRRGDYSIDANDVSQRLTVSAQYNLPFGKNGRFLTHTGRFDRLVSGFQTNTILITQTGRPIGITGASNQGAAVRPNYVPGVSVHVPNPSRTKWFNTGAYVNPPDYTFGNVPRYDSQLRGPGAVNVDLSLFKTTAITKRSQLQLRVEAFNVFNHVNLGMPNTTFTAGAPADPTHPYAEGGLNTSSTFGQITSALNPRNLQIAAKFSF